MSHYLDFVDLKYKPHKDDLVCLFRFEPGKGISAKEAIGRIAAESSNGTWSETEFGAKEHIRSIRGRAFHISGDLVYVAYPLDLFELGSMPQLFSSVGGNIFGMKAMNNLRLEDIYFSEKYLKSFRGPQFGINGVRNFMKVKQRPMIACVPKPKVGMYTEEHADTAYKFWIGGGDFLKDDENLTDQNFNRFDARVKLCSKMRDKAEKETGEKKDYFINITAETNEMLRRAKVAYDNNFKYIMVDIVTAGWSGLQTVREFCQDHKLAIHAHRAMHATFTRNPKHGISMLTLAKCARLVGVDNIHIGTAVGKLVSPKEEVMAIAREITEEYVRDSDKINMLNQKWCGVKDTIPVSSGGLHPGILPFVMKMLGNDCVIQVGGGIHGHPGGTMEGSKAVRQAIEATLDGVKLKDYAKNKHELRLALEKWGELRPI